MLEVRLTKTQFVQNWIVFVLVCTVVSIILWFARQDIPEDKNREKYTIIMIVFLLPLFGTLFASVFAKSFVDNTPYYSGYNY